MKQRRMVVLSLCAIVSLLSARPAGAGSPDIVISQIYGGGGNSGATLRNDFIELFNHGAAAVSLNGWSVQYASSGGTSWQVTPLSGSILPGKYYLIEQAAGAGGTAALPEPNAAGSIVLAASAGKVALVKSTTPLSGSGCPIGPPIADFAGYGGSSDCFEGTGPTSAPGNATAVLRKSDGCRDSNVNSIDFVTGNPNPRNGAHPPNGCIAPPPPSFRRIHDIQGSGSRSSFAGQTVSTSGIVTARRTNGFFMQTPDAEADGNPNTSEGIFVFTGSPVPPGAAVGSLVSVAGTIEEFRPSTDPASPPLTELTGPDVTFASAGHPLPAAITLTAADTPLTGSPEQLERFEGMRVRVGSLKVVAPTQGFVSEANATATSNGIFFGVISGVPRPFREPGIDILDPLPVGSPCCVPRFDTNPERVRVDSDGLAGASRIDVAAGSIVSNLAGVLDFGARAYTLLPDPGTPPSVSGNIAAMSVPVPASGQFTVASFNLQRLFDTENDPSVSDVVVTSTAFNNRLKKYSLAIRNVMHSPDIIGVEEAENVGVLQALAGRLNDDSVAAGQSNPAYQAFLVEGNDPGGIDSGFLVKTSRVQVIDVTQEGNNATYINPAGDQPDRLNDRPPLVLRALAMGSPFTVIVNHLRSLNDVDDPSEGPRVRAKRRAQAEFIAGFIQSRLAADPNERIISVGDYNAYEFSDGFVDTIGTIKGTPAPDATVVLASRDLVDPDLLDTAEISVPPGERYSYSFAGSVQTLDHILITGNALPFFERMQYARNNADFPEIYRNDPDRPERISDHDMPVAYFGPPNQPPSADAGADRVIQCTGQSVVRVTLTGAGADPDGGAPAFSWNGPHGTSAGAVLNLALRVGTYRFNLTVTDAGGLSATDSIVVTVQDGGAPAIRRLTARPAVLRLPLPRMIDVAIGVEVSDICDRAPACVVESVTSNQAPGGREPDYQVVRGRISGSGQLIVRLRAERLGGTNRVYSVRIRCRDHAGNSSVRTVTVVVAPP